MFDYKKINKKILLGGMAFFSGSAVLCADVKSSMKARYEAAVNDDPDAFWAKKGDRLEELKLDVSSLAGKLKTAKGEAVKADADKYKSLTEFVKKKANKDANALEDDGDAVSEALIKYLGPSSLKSIIDPIANKTATPSQEDATKDDAKKDERNKAIEKIQFEKLKEIYAGLVGRFDADLQKLIAEAKSKIDAKDAAKTKEEAEFDLLSEALKEAVTAMKNDALDKKELMSAACFYFGLIDSINDHAYADLNKVANAFILEVSLGVSAGKALPDDAKLEAVVAHINNKNVKNEFLAALGIQNGPGGPGGPGNNGNGSSDYEKWAFYAGTFIAVILLLEMIERRTGGMLLGAPATSTKEPGPAKKKAQPVEEEEYFDEGDTSEGDEGEDDYEEDEV